MAQPPPKTLPGFLRRSIRTAYDDTDNLPISFTDSSRVSDKAKSTAGILASGAVVSSTKNGDSLNHSEDLDLSLDEEMATSSAVNRRFRMSLSLESGGTNKSDGDVATGNSIHDTNTEQATPTRKIMPTRRPSTVQFIAPLKDVEDKMKGTSDHNEEISLTARSTTPSTSATVENEGVEQSSKSQAMHRKKSYKEIEFEKAITSQVINVVDLRRLCWNGIPPEHRPKAWKILLGYLPANSSRRKQTLERKRAEYRDAIAQHYDIDDNSRTMQEQETLRQVLVDVPRTAPDVGLFRNDQIRQSLARLLYIWAMRHPASSYVQGINDLTTPLLAVFLSEYFAGKDVMGGQILEDLSPQILEEVEADVYWCLTNLLAGIQDHYTSDQPGVQRMVLKLEELANRIDIHLTEHLRKTGIEFMQFAFKWMNCLLLREFDLRCIIRLWDTYLSEGDDGFESFHVYVCAAFLCQFSGEIQTMEFDELFGFMQNIPTSDWGDSEIEILLSQAFVLSTLFQGSDAHLAIPR